MAFTFAPLVALALTALPAWTLNNGLALRPQMGWSTWNSFACDIDASTIKESAQELVDGGFKDFGYEYLNIDDCWQADERDEGTNILQANKEKFPDGLKAVVDSIHDLGLKAGIYSSAGTLTCGHKIASLDFEQVDAQSYADAGIDYLKYDNCYNQGRSGNPKLSFDRYDAMGKALNATGRPILYSACNWGVDGPWNFGTTIFNSWRISGDITNSFNREDERCPCDSMIQGSCNLPGYHCSIEKILNYAAPLSQKSYSGAWNDLDALEIGNPEGEGLTLNEKQLHMTMWSMVKSPLIMGNVLKNISNEDKAILQNEAIIDLNQDINSTAANRIYKQDIQSGGSNQVWLQTLSNNSYAVAAVNFASESWDYTPRLKDVFFDSPKTAKSAFKAYDLWEGVDYDHPHKKGQRKLKALSGSPFKTALPHVTVQPHQVKVWKLVPVDGDDDSQHEKRSEQQRTEALFERDI
ncbi:unnamed protein product [Sympodiomycopsis kandeliae]